MGIEKLHGLHSTGISMNDRFTVLASTSPFQRVPTPRKRNPVPAIMKQNLDMQNQILIQQIARSLGQQARRQSIRQRLGVSQGALRRFGSETSLPGLRRSNSFGNLSQRGSITDRIGWRGSHQNLSRSASFSNLSEFRPRRGFRRRGGVRILRGRPRGLKQGRVTRLAQKGNFRPRGDYGGRGRGRGNFRGRGKARGGVTRQQKKEVPTKEKLDSQLDEYMSSTKSALDKELDEYMKSAMDLE